MAGLNLTGALAEFRNGVAWNNQQKQVDVENQQRQIMADAKAAGAAAVQQAQAPAIAQQQKAWTDAGKDPAQFQPQPIPLDAPTVLAGMHARSDSIAKSGDLNLWTQNEAQTAPVRQAIRQQVISKALADYDATGDGAALAQTVYPTVHDGVDIKSITADPTGGQGMQGASATAAAGQPVKPAYKITLSDGKSHTLTGDQIASMAHDAMMNPSDTAKYEFESRLQRAKSAADIATNAAKESARGAQDRQTEQVKGGYHLQGIGLQGQNALAVGAGNNAATIKAAGIHAGATVEAAGILGDSRVDAAGLRASGGPGGANKVQKTLVDSDGYVVNQFKDGTMARAMIGGQPVRSGDWAKRVDSMAKTLQNTPGNFKKSPADLRDAAIQALASPGSPSAPTSGLAPAPQPGAAPTPGLTAPPAPGAASAPKKDYSSLWGISQ